MFPPGEVRVFKCILSVVSQELHAAILLVDSRGPAEEYRDVLVGGIDAGECGLPEVFQEDRYRDAMLHALMIPEGKEGTDYISQLSP